MIVPRPALILLTLVTFVPFLGLAVSSGAFILPASAILTLVIMVAGMDAYVGRRRLSAIKVRLPEKLRWVQKRASLLELSFATAKSLPLHLRVGLGLPPEFNPKHEELRFQLPGQAGNHLVSYECVPTQRGLFNIDGCYFEAKSPLRLWDVRGSDPRPVEVRVYPNMEAERKQSASLFLRTRHSGAQAIRQVGQGRDFEKLREYVPGDGFDTIHWKATARRGHPITKVFQLEKTQEIYVIVDSSRLSGRLQVSGDPSQGTHLDRYITAALILGLAAEKQGDLFGLVTFGDRVGNFVRARNGKEHYGACREALYRLEAQPVSPDYDDVASFIRTRLRRRALLVFMTDLDDPILMESFQRAADVMSEKHLVIVQMLQPDHIQQAFTNPKVASVDDVYKDLGYHMAWHNLRQLTLSLKQHGVTLSVYSKEAFSAETTSNYIRVKQRQLI
jgi:uncharacterized protein (DUF58 family)